MKKSFVLLFSLGILAIPAIATPVEQACEKKVPPTHVPKKQVLKKQVQPYKWKSVLSGPFESFMYRVFY